LFAGEATSPASPPSLKTSSSLAPGARPRWLVRRRGKRGEDLDEDEGEG